MGSDGFESTVQRFPAYAELTQKAAWSTPSGHIHADASDVLAAVEVSSTSRYADGPELGRGGMGKVLLARDARIGRDVALKVLHAEHELTPADRARFVREAQVQGQLEHPSIVPVYDIERRDDGTTFFTMRRVHGKTLSTILDDLRDGSRDAQARYTQRELLTAFGTVCLAIDYAHTRGVVHRDLKPANIMLGEYGEVYVLDWGLARLVGERQAAIEDSGARLSMPGSFLGTPMYVAPEQMADPDVGPTADVYSLGLILFEILTLLRARDPNALLAPVDVRASVRAPARNVPPELETACIKATDGDPALRYPSARALHEAIARYLEGDRELAQRRELASVHVAAARAAIGRSVEADDDQEYDEERGRAVTELGRAVALDPSDRGHLAMLGELMAAVPSRRLPPVVKTRLDEETQHTVHVGATFAATAMASWFLFVPLLWWSGFADVTQLLLLALPLILSVTLNVVVARRVRVHDFLQYVTITVIMITTAMISRLYGPFIMLPTMVGTFAIVLQTHPRRHVAIFACVVALLAFVVPALLEWFRLVPPAYSFEGGVLSVLPQIVEFPRTQTMVFMLVANVASILGPVLLVHRLRTDLSAAQLKLALQAYHFERLGAQLVGAPLPSGARAG